MRVCGYKYKEKVSCIHRVLYELKWHCINGTFCFKHSTLQFLYCFKLEQCKYIQREALSSRMEVTLILLSLLKCLGQAVSLPFLQKWKQVPACLQLVHLPWGMRKDRAQARSFWALCCLLLFWDLQWISWKLALQFYRNLPSTPWVLRPR